MFRVNLLCVLFSFVRWGSAKPRCWFHKIWDVFQEKNRNYLQKHAWDVLGGTFHYIWILFITHFTSLNCPFFDKEQMKWNLIEILVLYASFCNCFSWTCLNFKLIFFNVTILLFLMFLDSSYLGFFHTCFFYTWHLRIRLKSQTCKTFSP